MRIATPVNMIILNKKKQVLLLQRAEKEDRFHGYWAIPGGGPKENETFEQALKREIKEETGTKITKVDYYKSFYYVVNPELHVRSLYFFGEISGKIKIDKESKDYKWFSFDEIAEMKNIAFNQKEILIEFCEDMSL